MAAPEDSKRSASTSASAGETDAGCDTPDERIDRLTAALAEKSEEAARNWDLYLRERADLENFKKRMQRDRTDTLRYAIEPLVRDLLPVIDNLERAVDHAASGGDGQPFIDGVRLVLKSALDVLERHGIRRIDATGQPFDPARHEAVAQVAAPDRQSNQVVQQFEPGYSLHDRLIRAAKVSVSSQPSVESPPDDD